MTSHHFCPDAPDLGVIFYQDPLRLTVFIRGIVLGAMPLISSGAPYLVRCLWLFWPEHLRNINLLHTLVNSHNLNLDTIKSVIAQMRRIFIKLHKKFHLSESLKLHIIFSHYVEYFELTGHTLLKYTDEVTEAVHSQLRMFEERHQYKRNNKDSTGHAKAQHNCIVFFNSVALGDL